MNSAALREHRNIAVASLSRAVKSLESGDVAMAEAHAGVAQKHLAFAANSATKPHYSLGQTIMKCSLSGDEVRLSAYYWLEMSEIENDTLISLVGELSAYAPDKTALYARELVQRIRNNRHQTPATPEVSSLSVNSGVVGCA